MLQLQIATKALNVVEPGRLTKRGTGTVGMNMMDQAHCRPQRGHLPQVREIVVFLRGPLSSSSSLELYDTHAHTHVVSGQAILQIASLHPIRFMLQ
mmetsp:Transcript_38697/g.70466  ORF Transcript_38697/g.70466 Transcript_38697/m.70466 type:complete len:96 (+) Transcript_38697:520-807(+)